MWIHIDHSYELHIVTLTTINDCPSYEVIWSSQTKSTQGRQLWTAINLISDATDRLGQVVRICRLTGGHSSIGQFVAKRLLLPILFPKGMNEIAAGYAEQFSKFSMWVYSLWGEFRRTHREHWNWRLNGKGQLGRSFEFYSAHLRVAIYSLWMKSNGNLPLKLTIERIWMDGQTYWPNVLTCIKPNKDIKCLHVKQLEKEREPRIADSPFGKRASYRFLIIGWPQEYGKAIGTAQIIIVTIIITTIISNKLDYSQAQLNEGESLKRFQVGHPHIPIKP